VVVLLHSAKFLKSTPFTSFRANFLLMCFPWICHKYIKDCNVVCHVQSSQHLVLTYEFYILSFIFLGKDDLLMFTTIRARETGIFKSWARPWEDKLVHNFPSRIFIMWHTFTNYIYITMVFFLENSKKYIEMLIKYENDHLSKLPPFVSYYYMLLLCRNCRNHL